MAKLILSRRKEWQNRGRKFGIYIDGEKADVLENGEIKELELDPGKHTVKFKMDWMSSPEKELEISEEKSKSVEVSGFKLGKWLYPLFYLVLALFFIIKVFLEKTIDELVYIMIPLLAVYLYYLTIGRKKYLEIKEL
ncbi:MAG: hypothetical protein V2I54_08595 [Bacteroidales bacterium]|jgi:hypothetical protein|nr:hypothetical protein [Bacteroidales bacterium]